MLIEELKGESKTELCRLIYIKRHERISKQKRYIADQMKDEIDKQLQLIKIIKSSQYTTEEKDIAYCALLEFLKQEDKIYSDEFFKESRFIIEYAIEKEDIDTVDYLLKRRTTICEDIEACSHGRLHVVYVDKMLKLDALKGLDTLALQHIESATKGDYGTLLRCNGPHFYYYYEEDYIKMYTDYKTELKEKRIML